jgi:hypothetical protein
MLYKNGINLNDSLLDFIENANKLSIYIPYIKLPQLKHLLKASIQVEKIIVRWEPNDLILGSSDREVYLFLKERGIKLYRNPRLHLKAFIDGYQKAFIGSANISQRALNFPETSNYNYELGVIIENLSLSDRLYFQTIAAESTLITDKIYDALAEQISTQKTKTKVDDNFKFEFSELMKSFLISALPMSYDIETLKRIYSNEISNEEIEVNCLLHDLAIYQIPFGLAEADFISELKLSFFKHPFIKAFLTNLDGLGEIYFGSAKEWIHKNCSDAPIPRKWEITSNIQILFRWIVYLSDGTYSVDRPNYSERLYKVDQWKNENHSSVYVNDFIDSLSRDKVRGDIAPHQIILLISLLNLYTPLLKKQIDIDELIKEFDLNWNKYDYLYKSINKNAGLPLKALYNKGLLTIDMYKPIEDYRNMGEISQKIQKISLNDELTRFLSLAKLESLKSRITI